MKPSTDWIAAALSNLVRLQNPTRRGSQAAPRDSNPPPTSLVAARLRAMGRSIIRSNQPRLGVADQDKQVGILGLRDCRYFWPAQTSDDVRYRDGMAHHEHSAACRRADSIHHATDVRAHIRRVVLQIYDDRLHRKRLRQRPCCFICPSKIRDDHARHLGAAEGRREIVRTFHSCLRQWRIVRRRTGFFRVPDDNDQGNGGARSGGLRKHRRGAIRPHYNRGKKDRQFRKRAPFHCRLSTVPSYSRPMPTWVARPEPAEDP